jgi:hypothetical protein
MQPILNTRPALNLNRPLPTSRPVPSRPNAPPGAYGDRQSRFDVRAGKRWGDLGLYEIPATLLWLEAACAPSLFNPAPCIAPPIADLWP